LPGASSTAKGRLSGAERSAVPESDDPVKRGFSRDSRVGGRQGSEFRRAITRVDALTDFGRIGRGVRPWRCIDENHDADHAADRV